MSLQVAVCPRHFCSGERKPPATRAVLLLPWEMRLRRKNLERVAGALWYLLDTGTVDNDRLVNNRSS